MDESQARIIAMLDALAIRTEELNSAMISGFADVNARMSAGFDRLDNRIARLETRVENVETRLTGVETRLTGVETRLNGVEHEVKELHTSTTSRLAALESKG